MKSNIRRPCENLILTRSSFHLTLSNIDDKIKQEAASLDDNTLDDVMRDAIGRVFECMTSEWQYNLSIRNRLRWEIVE